MPAMPFVSIIIPCKNVDDYTNECIEHCKRVDYADFEIILLPDYNEELINGVRIIATGPVSPGNKRNIGVKNSNGAFCAFIDNDAYPRSDWLTNALKYFEDPTVGGVGGPGLTPEADGFMQKAGGYVLSSFMVGNLSSRYKTKSCFESDDIHSCNFIARKTVLEAAGGWNEKYWPGEDTLMCLAIKETGKKTNRIIRHSCLSPSTFSFQTTSETGFKIWRTSRVFCQKVPRELGEVDLLLSIFLVSSLLVGVVLSPYFSRSSSYVVLFGVGCLSCFKLNRCGISSQKREVDTYQFGWE